MNLIPEPSQGEPFSSKEERLNPLSQLQSNYGYYSSNRANRLPNDTSTNLDDLDLKPMTRLRSLDRASDDDLGHQALQNRPEGIAKAEDRFDTPYERSISHDSIHIRHESDYPGTIKEMNQKFDEFDDVLDFTLGPDNEDDVFKKEQALVNESINYKLYPTTLTLKSGILIVGFSDSHPPYYRLPSLYVVIPWNPGFVAGDFYTTQTLRNCLFDWKSLTDNQFAVTITSTEFGSSENWSFLSDLLHAVAYVQMVANLQPTTVVTMLITNPLSWAARFRLYTMGMPTVWPYSDGKPSIVKYSGEMAKGTFDNGHNLPLAIAGRPVRARIYKVI